jgi:acetolactate synthase-1/2/3 large subunit
LDFVLPAGPDLPGWKPAERGHPGQIAEAARRIARAERPVLYVGGGTINGEACAELRELAEAGDLPVVTTLMAKGAFPEGHELHFGWPGMHGGKWANLAINRSDVLVAVGARFDDRVTGRLDSFAPDAAVIHLDIDAAEISKLRHADVPVVGQLKQVLAEITPEVARLRAGGDAPPPSAWLAQIAQWREAHPLRYAGSDDGEPNADGTLKPQALMELLERVTAGRNDVIWTTGVGQHQMWAMQYLRCTRPRSFITSGGLGTMGFGVPAAVGAKAARPDATVVCVDGDGCFQMTNQEIATAVLEGLPVVIVVVNNGNLGMVAQWQDMFYAERYSNVHLTAQVPDYAALARAYGAVGYTVETEDDLQSAFEASLGSGRTVVIDARVTEHEHCLPIVPVGASAVDMIEHDDGDKVELEVDA